MSRLLYRSSTRPPSRVIKSESTARRVMEQRRLRLMCIGMFFALSFAALGLRLIEVSLVGGGDLPFKRMVAEPQLLLQAEEAGAEEIEAVLPKDVRRHNIEDRNGNLLATSVSSAALVANPSLIREPRVVARKLSSILNEVSFDFLYERLNQPDKRFVYLKRRLDPSEQQQVHNLGQPGLFFEPKQLRVYPYAGLLGHVIGYVDVDNKGIAGLEKTFDTRLSSPYHDEETLQLSIDLRVQMIMHDALREAMEEFSAIGATGIVYDMQKGELLALANLPEFDPHSPADAPAEARFNRATLGAYEMGSTFKAFTVAMALEHGVVDLDDGYDATNPIKVARYVISDSHPKKRWLSVPEIFAYSSNIGTVKMALDVGTSRQRSFLRKLGLMEPVDIEIPEKAHPLVPDPWREINTMTISYGHGISVSPLHLVRAIAAITGDGRLPHLSLVKDGNKHKPRGERVVSVDTAHAMRKLMRTVVEYGTASHADVPGYRVGGKTGTAEKVKAGSYKDKEKLASFVSIFPSDNPRYVVLAMLDEPQGTDATYGYATGGWVSAPVVAKVVNRIGPMLGVAPKFEKPNPKEEAFWARAEQLNKQAKNRRVHAVAY